MSKFHNDNSLATDRVQIEISEQMLRPLQPELYGWRSYFRKFRLWRQPLNARRTRELIAEHMTFGDSRAALVMQESPLIVSAYTDEMDCVALLSFPEWLVRERQLRKGSRLLTVNTYGNGKSGDLEHGPADTGRFTSFYPVIAEFVSDDLEIIGRRKQGIGAAEWNRTLVCGNMMMGAAKRKVRDGRPLVSWKAGV